MPRKDQQRREAKTGERRVCCGETENRTKESLALRDEPWRVHDVMGLAVDWIRARD